MSAKFSMSDGASGPAYVLEVVEDVDITTADALRSYVAAVAGDERLRLVIDLRAVTFIDSSGIGFLVWAHRALRGRLTIRGVQPPVQHVFDLTGLAGFWCREPG